MKLISDSITPLRFQADNHSRTVYYDVSCNLCIRSVQFIIRYSDKGVFDFVPLQYSGEDSYNYISGSIIFKDQANVYAKSDAVLHIFKYLRWPWSWIYSFKIFPRFLRDGVYLFISKNRYKWFGNCNCQTEKV